MRCAESLANSLNVTGANSIALEVRKAVYLLLPMDSPDFVCRGIEQCRDGTSQIEPGHLRAGERRIHGVNTGEKGKSDLGLTPLPNARTSPERALRLVPRAQSRISYTPELNTDLSIHDNLLVDSCQNGRAVGRPTHLGWFPTDVHEDIQATSFRIVSPMWSDAFFLTQLVRGFDAPHPDHEVASSRLPIA